MAVTYIVQFQVVPDQRGRFLELLQGVLDAMREEPMFLEATLHRDPESDNRFMLYESWKSHEDVVKVQLERSYRRIWHEALPTMLEGPREISIWEPLRADRRAP